MITRSTVAAMLAAAFFSPPARGGDSTAVCLRFGGDLLLAEHYERASMDGPGPAFDGFDLLRSADIAMVNLECPVTTRGAPAAKPYTFRMHPRFVDVIKGAGIDIVTLANNHIFDFGVEGVLDTFSYLDAAGILRVGAGRDSQEAHQPAILDVRGVKIAFLGYYGGGEAPGAGQRSPGVARREPRRMAADIRNLRDSVNYIVVNLHWGTEKAALPDESQTRVARGLIRAGADLVVGHHPHVLQGIERYHGGIIAYSLGNFVFGGNSRHTYDTALLEVRLLTGGAEATVLPVGIRNWRATALEGKEAESIIRLVRRRSEHFPRSIFTDP